MLMVNRIRYPINNDTAEDGTSTCSALNANRVKSAASCSKPAGRAYLVFAGLEQLAADLTRLAFSAEQVESLRALPVFERVDPAIVDKFGDIRFTGDVWSVSEGTILFPGEPLVRVEAPLAEAQWIETLLIASLNYPTLVASKAARIVGVAGGRSLYDFGARRGHGPHAGLLAARAAYLAGFDGTSHVEAGRRLGITGRR